MVDLRDFQWDEVYPRARLMVIAGAVMVPYGLSIRVSEWFLLPMAVLVAVGVRDLSRVADHELLGGLVVRALRAFRAHGWVQSAVLAALAAVAATGAVLGEPASFGAGFLIWIALAASAAPIFQYALGRTRGRIEAPVRSGSRNAGRGR